MKLIDGISLIGRRGSGFALLATLSLLFLMTVIAVAVLTLAAVNVRSTRADFHMEEARANARLALMLAIGELQREMGPDQRISATAEILEDSENLNLDLSAAEGEGEMEHPYWVGVWDSTLEGGRPIWERRSGEGGLKDMREESQWEKREMNRSFLVSGNEGGQRNQNAQLKPWESLDQEREAVIVSEGSVGQEQRGRVRVAKTAVRKSGQETGNYAYWIGDLGVRANIATGNPYQDGSEAEGPERIYPFLAAPEAAPEVLGDGEEFGISEEQKAKLVSLASLEHLEDYPDRWRESLFHDVTIDSEGVLSDTRDGGLKKNLTAFLNRDTDILDLESEGEAQAGLAQTDNLVGPPNPDAALQRGISWDESRHRETSPNFGLLRDWAHFAREMGQNEEVIVASNPAPESEYELPQILEESSQNLRPAALRQAKTSNFNPILVEASMFNGLSCYRNDVIVNPRRIYNLRSHFFPRVVLWNPYSVQVKMEPAVAMVQVNGRRGFQTNTASGFRATWISWAGRTPTPSGLSGQSLTDSDAFNDAYTGSFYFYLPSTTFEPGECLTFLPSKNAIYDSQNVLNNEMSVEARYLTENNFYTPDSVYNQGISFIPTEYWFVPSNNQRWFGRTGGIQQVQADDAQMILKSLGDQTPSSLSVFEFDTLPQIAAVSCSMQYGAGKEPTEAWSDGAPVTGSGVRIPFLDTSPPVFETIPDRRTRQGYRMRWFQEHPSHTNIVGNPLVDQPEFWEESFLGSWNLRGAYAVRTPFENLAGNRGDENASGPWFFGIYTRDLYDIAAGWEDQTPVRRNGKNYGNPFGTPDEGALRYVLYDLPDEEIGIVSMAQFQHAKLSEFVWHPSYAVGNSLVDPRLSKAGISGTHPAETEGDREKGGFVRENIGWSDNSDRGQGRETWAEYGRAFLLDTSEEEDLVYDLSFELNHTLWDRYFLSSGTSEQLAAASRDPIKNPLPNARMIPVTPGKDLEDFHTSARDLMVKGAFNVNSTSVKAWQAVLSANRRQDDGMTPFPRVIGRQENEWQDGDSLDGDEVWDGTRILRDEEILRLAQAIVKQVRERGPFLSLSDFVNRRLVDNEQEHGMRGPLEAAIQEAGINRGFDTELPYAMTQEDSLETFDHPDNIQDPTRLEQTMKPPSRAWGAPVYLTQADLLQTIGASLAARSDTFVIRAYGESVLRGRVAARAWCEAVVQRTPEPIYPDSLKLNPVKENGRPDFGRRFRMTRFRWLNRSEV